VIWPGLAPATPEIQMLPGPHQLVDQDPRDPGKPPPLPRVGCAGTDLCREVSMPDRLISFGKLLICPGLSRDLFREWQRLAMLQNQRPARIVH
jgi:hypothetical protein